MRSTLINKKYGFELTEDGDTFNILGTQISTFPKIFRIYLNAVRKSHQSIDILVFPPVKITPKGKIEGKELVWTLKVFMPCDTKAWAVPEIKKFLTSLELGEIQENVLGQSGLTIFAYFGDLDSLNKKLLKIIPMMNAHLLALQTNR
jgi:hypothetical protein